MEDIIIESTKKTPNVDFSTNGTIRMNGRSTPEDARGFYISLLNWITEYCKDPNQITVVDIELEYFNSASAKYILLILRELVNVTDKGYKVEINWHYEVGDDDILERGEYYASILDTEINFIEFE